MKPRSFATGLVLFALLLGVSSAAHATPTLDIDYRIVHTESHVSGPSPDDTPADLTPGTPFSPFSVPPPFHGSYAEIPAVVGDPIMEAGSDAGHGSSIPSPMGIWTGSGHASGTVAPGASSGPPDFGATHALSLFSIVFTLDASYIFDLAVDLATVETIGGSSGTLSSPSEAFAAVGLFSGAVAPPDLGTGPALFGTEVSGPGGLASFSTSDILGPGTYTLAAVASIYLESAGPAPTITAYAEFDELSFELTAEPVPEPTTLLLLGTGLAGLALYRRRVTA